MSPEQNPPRIPPLPAAERSPEQAELVARTTVGGRPEMNIFATLVRHPRLYDRWTRFGNVLLARGLLPARERELAILRTGYLCATPYEWGHHVEIALAAGLTREEVDRVPAGPSHPDWSAHDAAVLKAADELHGDARIGDDTWGRLAAVYDDAQMIELCMVVGQYHLVAFTLNSLGVQREDGVEDLPT